MDSGFSPEESSFVSYIVGKWRKEWLLRGLCWWVIVLLWFCCAPCIELMHLWNSSPIFKNRANSLWAWEQTNSAFPISFSQFHPHSSPPPHTNEMCQSHDTLLAAESIASVGQMRSRLLLSGLAGNQECPPSPPPRPLPPPPPPPPPSFPNGSYQTHQEICDRTVLKIMRRLPPTSPEVEDYEPKCLASVCFLSVHARVLFLHKLNGMGGSLMSPEHEVSCREHKSFCLANRKRQDVQRVYSYFISLLKISFINSL